MSDLYLQELGDLILKFLRTRLISTSLFIVLPSFCLPFSCLNCDLKAIRGAPIGRHSTL
jgi:hypothetical protein